MGACESKGAMLTQTSLLTQGAAWHPCFKGIGATFHELLIRYEIDCRGHSPRVMRFAQWVVVKASYHFRVRRAASVAFLQLRNLLNAPSLVSTEEL